MVSQELITYVQNELRKGTPPEVLNSQLLAQGWKQENIVTALNSLSNQQNTQFFSQNTKNPATSSDASGTLNLPYIIKPQAAFTIILVSLGTIMSLLLLTIIQRGQSSITEVLITICFLWIIIGSIILWLRSKKIIISQSDISYGKKNILYSQISSVSLDASRGGPIISLTGDTARLIFSLKPFSKNDTVILLQTIYRYSPAAKFDGLSNQLLHNDFKTVNRKLLSSFFTYGLPLLLIIYGGRIFVTALQAKHDCQINPNANNIFCKKQTPALPSVPPTGTTINSQSPTKTVQIPTRISDSNSSLSMFTSTLNNFSILFPGIPQHTTKTFTITNSSQTVTSDTYKSDYRLLPDQTVYQVQILTYPATAIGFLQPTSFFPQTISDDVKNYPGDTLISSQLGAFQGFPSADYTIHIVQPNAYIITKSLLINNYVYFLRAFATTAAPPDYNRFVQSFHYLSH